MVCKPKPGDLCIYCDEPADARWLVLIERVEPGTISVDTVYGYRIATGAEINGMSFAFQPIELFGVERYVITQSMISLGATNRLSCAVWHLDNNLRDWTGHLCATIHADVHDRLREYWK